MLRSSARIRQPLDTRQLLIHPTWQDGVLTIATEADPRRAWVGLRGLAGTGYSERPGTDHPAPRSQSGLEMIRPGADTTTPPVCFGTTKLGRRSGTQHGKPEGAGVRGGMGNGLVDAREREFRDVDVIEREHT